MKIDAPGHAARPLRGLDARWVCDAGGLMAIHDSIALALG